MHPHETHEAKGAFHLASGLWSLVSGLWSLSQNGTSPASSRASSATRSASFLRLAISSRLTKKGYIVSLLYDIRLRGNPSVFARQLSEHVGDEDFRAFQNELLIDPERGDLLVGCRGLRKTRMALVGRGKSGGARVIYLYLPEDHVIYLFLLFKKSDTANLSKSQRNQLSLLADQIKSTYAQKRQNP